MAIPRRSTIRALRRERPSTGTADAAAQARKAALISMELAMHEVETRLAEIDRLKEEIAAFSGEVETAMTALEMQEHQFLSMRAKLEDEYGNAVREVSVESVYNKLPEKDFFKVVKVQMGALKEHMSENEINRISKTTPGKYKGKKFTLERVSAKAGRGKKQ